MGESTLTEPQRLFLAKNALSEEFLEQARVYFDPMLEALLSHKPASRALIVGVNGAQGSGKSTLCAYWVMRSQTVMGINACCVSIDDFYYSRVKRQELAQNVHPLLATRGVPGTHDVAAIHAFFDAVCLRSFPLSVPRFDKAKDDPFPQSSWPVVTEPLDLVFFEGWCVASQPEPPAALVHAVNALEREYDPNAVWRKYVNNQLAGPYHELFDRLDQIIFLQAPSFDEIWRWRWEQEEKLRATLSETALAQAHGLMSQEAVKAFVAHYERVTKHSLLSLPKSADGVFLLDRQRRIQGVKGKLGKRVNINHDRKNSRFY